MIDSRDGKFYTISKLADGNCWMTQNLALDGGITITPSDSNVTSNVDLPATASSCSSSDTSIQIWAQQSGYDGNYYNWCAAIASASNCNTTTEQTTSICPKGWRLPSNSGSPSYRNLFDTAGISSMSTDADKVAAAEAVPYSFTRAGYYNGGYYVQGSYGYYWSRTPGSSSSAYYFVFGASYFGPQDDFNKDYGRSVRCVYGS